MDVMEARRRLLMMSHGLDTSPKIIGYNQYYEKNNTIKDYTGDSITDIYHYSLSSEVRNIYSYGLTPYTLIYKDNGQTFLDWWAINTMSEPKQSGKLNANSDSIVFSIRMSRLDDCYAYCVETGEIFFAGKNSIYYGHRNISELE